jgi:hypothetical protein
MARIEISPPSVRTDRCHASWYAGAVSVAEPKEMLMSTQKYLVILRSTPGSGAQEAPSPAQMQEMYAAFNAWKEKFKANIVDMGGKLKSGGRMLSVSGVTDGPFIEMKEIIGGFMVVAAGSYEQAVEIAKGCPGVVRPGATVEIREIVSV